MSPDQHANLVLVGVFAAWLVGCTAWAVISWRRSAKTAGQGCWIAFAWAFWTFCGFCCVIVMPHVLRSARLAGEDHACESNLMQIGQALNQYEEDNDDQLPPAKSWATDATLYLPQDKRKQAFHCPSASSPYSYAFNKALSGKAIDPGAIDTDVVMLFECDAKTINASGSATDLCPPRHAGWDNMNFAFLDGHAGSKNNGDLSSLKWKP